MEYKYKIYHYSHYEYYSEYFTENTNKIIIPISLLLHINEEYDNQNHINLKLYNNDLFCYVSINTFSDNDNIYVPSYMLKILNLNNGDYVNIKLVKNINKGKKCKLQAQDKEFLKIKDHKECLENTLKNYTTISKNLTFKIYDEKYNEYIIKILDVFDENDVIDIIDVNLEIDFDKPLNYESPKIERKINIVKNKKNVNENEKKFVPFTGKGYSLK